MARWSKLARAVAPSLAGALLGLACLAPVAAQVASAQDARDDAGEPLVTDRPDFTESAETVARGRFQIEGGATFTDREEEGEQSFGEVLIRVGVARRFELRLGLDSWVRLDPVGPGSEVEGFADPALAAKAVLRADGDERRATPQLALLFGATLPIGSSELREPHAQPFAVLAASWDLSETISLGANLGGGLVSAGGEQYGELAASVAAGFGLSEKLGAFVELFGFLPEDDGGPSTSYLDAGFTWLLSNDLQLDVRAGVGLDGDADDLFAGVGLAWRR
jgi:hypothetical protein